MTASVVGSERQFSGLVSSMVVTYIEQELGSEVLGRVLDLAGAVDAEDDLRDDTAWVSYEQLRRLFGATAELCGGFEALRRAAITSQLHAESHADMTQMLQDFGSPGNLLRIMIGSEADSGTLGISTILMSDGEEVAPDEWLLRQRFTDGFEPFPEFCAFTCGLHALLPTLFGLPPGWVHEESCACDGAAECTFRLRWDATNDLSNQKTYFETRSRAIEARLTMLQRTVVELVSAPDPEEGLRRVLEAAARAVHAPAYVLAINSSVPVTPRLYYRGLNEPEAVAIAETLSDHVASDTPGMVVVEVASTRSVYGYLAAIQPGARRFLPQERELVRSCAGLAAAALDSVTALEEARRQATTARTLLDLSSSLTQLLSKEEMAVRLARAVPSVIDCDWSIVLVNEPSLGEFRVAATHGLPEATARDVASASLPPAVVSVLGDGVAFYDETQISRSESALGISFDDNPPVAAAAAPMIANGELIGALLVLVTSRPERLRGNPDLAESLRGLSGQAAVAIRNARLVDQVRHQALHDGLTGLPNRSLVLDRLEQALARASREGSSVTAMFLDLDGFKEINDTLGHAAGDQLLVALTDRLKGALRDSDTIGRLGGDEFVVVTADDSLTTGAQVVAERILDVLRVPFQLEGFDDLVLAVTTSIGIAIGHSESAGELLRNADIALYRAKEQGKNCFVLYEPDMSKRMRDRIELERDIVSAVGDRQFFLMYQPLFDSHGGRVIGAEAVIHWQHPSQGVVAADDFVPLLEEVGAVPEIGRWMLEEAARQGHYWHQLGHRLRYLGQHIARSARERHIGRGRCPCVVVERPQSIGPYHRDRPVRRLRRLRESRCRAPAGQSAGRQNCHRRLRNRVLGSRLPQPSSDRWTEDRQVLHHHHRGRHRARNVDARAARTRQDPRLDDARRRYRRLAADPWCG
jgi:diguanylate cyclase (GGDEF)-like protein